MSKVSSTAMFRLTGILPWVVGVALYITLIVKPEKGLISGAPSLAGFFALTSVMMCSIFAYLLMVWSFFSKRWENLTSAQELLRRHAMVALPLIIGVALGSVDGTINSHNEMLPLAIKVLLTLMCLPVIYLLSWLPLMLVGWLSTHPIWWLMGSPESTLPPQPQPQPSVTPVHQPQEPPTTDTAANTFVWRTPRLTLDDLIGVDAFKNELSQCLQGFEHYRKGSGPVCDRNGILLSGPPGNGKTTVAAAIAGELGLPFLKIGGQDITSKWVNESASMIKQLFVEASAQPCVLFFDEFEGIAVNRGGAHLNAEDRKVVNALLAEIDSARSKFIVLIAATNYIEQVDAAIARDGRFDFRMDIPYPDENGRVAVLTGMLQKHRVKADAQTIADIAHLWHLRPVSFIESTVKRLRDSPTLRNGVAASLEDFKTASRNASRNASAIPSAGAKLSDIALPSPVRKVANNLIARMRGWESIAKSGGEAPSGVVLYGPPGTGKTNLVRAMARELGDWHVFEVNAVDVLNNPKSFRETLDLATKHRPAIVFIDEADDLLRQRTHSPVAAATNEILKTMDGMMGKVPEVLFMAATNSVELLDGAALRGGRFSEQIYMGRLTGSDLVDLFEREFSKKAMVRFDEDLTPLTLAHRLGEAAAADAIGVLQKAINFSFDSLERRAVTLSDVDDAISLMRLGKF